MKTNGKIITIGLLCLILGSVIGFFIAGRITKKRIHQMVEMQRPPMFKHRLEDQLNLSNEQKLVFDETFEEHMGRMRGIDRGIRKHRDAEINRLFSEIEINLNAEQLTTLKNMRQRMGKREKHKRKRGRKRRHMK